MENHSVNLQYKVGLFISAGLLVFMVSLLLIGRDKAVFSRYIRLHAHFSEVQGLFPGSVVSLAGIPVGNVESIDFLPDQNALNVVLKINQKYQKRLVEGTTAEIRTQGALGDKYIYLQPGDPKGNALPNGALIEARETDFMKMITDRNDGIARVIDLVKEMHILVASLNADGRAADAAQNLSEAAKKLNTTLATLDVLLAEVRDQIPENKKLRNALVRLSNIMEKIDEGQGTLGQLINDPSIHQRLKSFLGGSPQNNYMKSILRETIQRSDAETYNVRTD